MHVTSVNAKVAKNQQSQKVQTTDSFVRFVQPATLQTKSE
jgi:hypothetical protein